MLTTELPIESHPFEPFVPKGATTLIIGSFPGLNGGSVDENGEKWFYSAIANGFWPLLSKVYDIDLATVKSRKELCTKEGLAITDIFKSIQRKKGNAADSNLIIKEYNDEAIKNILGEREIRKIFFTSKFVGKHYLKKFPKAENVFYLPSPSNAANMYLSTTADYNDYKQKSPEGDMHTYRTTKYKELLKGVAKR